MNEAKIKVRVCAPLLGEKLALVLVFIWTEREYFSFINNKNTLYPCIEKDRFRVRPAPNCTLCKKPTFNTVSVNDIDNDINHWCYVY